MPPAGPLRGKLYIAIDGTGVPMVPAETAGRPGKGEDGKARTREVKMACAFTQATCDDDGRPVRDPASSSSLATFAPGAGSGILARERDRQLGYFEVNAHRMRYARFRDLGMFVGSGAAEAGCKAVIGQWLKLSGMRWSIPGATGIVTLRCQEASGRWERSGSDQTAPAAPAICQRQHTQTATS